jgi:putative ABC transport system ATP-binding protein
VTLTLRDVVKHYRRGQLVRAVDGVSLRVARGELLALYGPSGSGKTTLLRLIASLLAPDSGEVRFGSLDVGRLTRAQKALYLRRQVGLVPQSFHLMPTTALNCVAARLLADGWSLRRARSAAQPWLERLDLGERLLHTPQELSMGERQRVAIARALVCDPALLLADEPTGNLDSTLTREVLALLRDIAHERAIPALVVTHDREAETYADNLLTLRDGRIHEGLPSEPVADLRGV